MRNRVRGIVLMVVAVVGWLMAAVAIPGYQSLNGPGKEDFRGKVLLAVDAVAVLIFLGGIFLFRKAKKDDVTK